MMTQEMRTWNLTEAEWADMLSNVQHNSNALQDGAYVRFEKDTGSLHFYATLFNKPDGWQYPFLEPIPETPTHGAFIGHAWHEPETGFVHFEVILFAAAQALRADYESDVSDMDYVTYEQAVEQAVGGSECETTWLHAEFERLQQAIKTSRT